MCREAVVVVDVGEKMGVSILCVASMAHKVVLHFFLQGHTLCIMAF